jgi:hypothetical protein
VLLIAAPSFGSMSTTPVIDTHLASEVAALRQLVNRMLYLAESAADQSQTIPEFCSTERISRAFYYEMRKAGRGPREMRHADGCVRISPEARRDWRRERERETAQST